MPNFKTFSIRGIMDAVITLNIRNAVEMLNFCIFRSFYNEL